MELVDYKIFKYKLKFLNSIMDKNFNKSVLYLKKYSKYINKNNFSSNSIQIGGFVIEIIDQKNLDDLILNVSNLINTIFGEDLGNVILNEFKIKTNINKITFPTKINIDVFIKNILKTVYYNSETGKYYDDEFEKKINTYIIDIVNNYRTKSYSKLKDYDSVKYLLDLIKTKEKSVQLPEINNNQTIITPTISIMYLQPVVNWNSDDLGTNIKFSDTINHSSYLDSKSNFNKKLRKKNKF